MGIGTRAKDFGTDGLQQVIDELRDRLDRRGAPAPEQRDVRSAVLALLAEGPLHGFEVIRGVEERTAGAWTPTAGEVYPTLQQLADEGLVAVTESEGRKLHALTEAGRVAAEAAGQTPWAPSPAAGHGALPKAGLELAQVAAQVQRTGTAEQKRRAAEAVDAARRQLHAILAQG